MAKQQPAQPIVHNLPHGEEAILKKFGLKIAERRLMNTGEIDHERSALNHARIGKPLLEDHITDMAVALLDNATVLPDLLVCFDGGNKKAVVWSGNNRKAAYEEAGITDYMVCIVYCSDLELLDLVPKILNRVGGEKLSQHDALKHAAYAIATYAWSNKKAAEAWGLTESAVNRHGRAEKVREALELLHIKVPAKASDSLLLALAPLLNNDHVLEQMGRLMVESEIGPAPLTALVRLVRAETTEAAQLAVAKQQYHIHVLSPKPRSPGKRGKAVLFRAATSNLLKMLGGVTSVKQLEITDREEVAAAHETLDKLIVEAARVKSGKARRRKSTD